MKIKKEQLTETERKLLDEYNFYVFISKLYNASNPILAQQLLEGLYSISGCNKLLLNSAVTEILTGAQVYKPRRVVYISLLSKVMTVKEICSYMHISMTTYYKALRTAKEVYGLPTPQFDEVTYAEVRKFLDYVSDLLPTKRRY